MKQKRLSVKSIVADLHASAERQTREAMILYDAQLLERSRLVAQLAHCLRQHADAYSRGKLVNVEEKP